MKLKSRLLGAEVERVFYERFKKYPSARELAQMIGISKSTAGVLLIGQLENPKINTLFLICEWMNRPLDEFIETKLNTNDTIMGISLETP